MLNAAMQLTQVNGNKDTIGMKRLRRYEKQQIALTLSTSQVLKALCSTFSPILRLLYHATLLCNIH